MATDVVATYGIPSEADLATQCEGPACVATFLTDYVTTSNYGCSDALVAQEEFNVISRAPWILCSDSVFGFNLVGAFCLSDANCTGGVCDTTSKVCVNQSYDALVDAFLTCLLDDQTGLVMPTVIRTYEYDLYLNQLSCLTVSLQEGHCGRHYFSDHLRCTHCLRWL